MENKNTIENELNIIRLNLYEQTKNMTPEEMTSYLKKLTAPVLKEFGIRTVSNLSEQQEVR